MSGRRRKSTTTPAAPAGGQDPKRKRSAVLPSSGAAAEKKGSSSSAPATVLVRDLTVEEHVLECIVCYLPLKPPIFQCTVGHVLCSPCSEKLKDDRKCHVCGVAMADGGYRRCHAMEDILNSIHGPCPHAPYGCKATPVYHAREEHLLQCPYAPFRCPGDNCGCSFVSSNLAALVEHLSAAHSWPCTAEPSPAGDSFRVDLRDGYNFLTAVRGSAKYLLLLNMATTPFGRAISAVSVGSSAPAAIRKTLWHIELATLDKPCQSSRFQVEGPFSDMPDPKASFQFFVPKYAAGYCEATVKINAKIVSISSS